ncbi:MAG: carbohydrate-binding family 9-like protein [Deltaproteobacteria bacterium]|nr:carbohydrate-binding family 9-like protein [Deltaproteobacteria bacterium]
MKRRIKAIILLVILSVFSAGCVEKTRHLTPADKERLKTLISKTAPRPSNKLDIKFEDKVLLLGYDLDKRHIQPGELFKITWYWKAEKDVGSGWQIFTHVADAKNISRINADAERVIRNLYPAEDWKEGEYIKDEQEVTIPLNWNSPEVRLYLGLWNGPHRMHVTRGKDDGEHRVLGAKISVKLLSELAALRTTNAVKIDGVLDEADWQKAEQSEPLTDTASGEKGAFKAVVRLMYDDQKLYAAFLVSDSYLKSAFTNRDDHLWEEDAVEIMLDPDGDGKNYFEIEVSPNNVVFDTRYLAAREPKPFGYMDWDSQAEAKTTLNGTLNDEQADEGYIVEIAIPWLAFNIDASKPQLAPAANSSWRMNFFVMDKQKGGQRAVGWSAPLVSDFHVPERFGTVIFSEAAPTDDAKETAESKETSERKKDGKEGEKKTKMKDKKKKSPSSDKDTANKVQKEPGQAK